MATRAPSQPQNRQINYGGNGSNSGSMDVGANAIAKMAREDTRWFIFAVVVLSAVLFFALPLAFIIYIDAAQMQAQVRYELKQLKKLKSEIKERHEKPSVDRSVDAPNDGV